MTLVGSDLTTGVIASHTQAVKWTCNQAQVFLRGQVTQSDLTTGVMHRLITSSVYVKGQVTAGLGWVTPLCVCLGQLCVALLRTIRSLVLCGLFVGVFVARLARNLPID